MKQLCCRATNIVELRLSLFQVCFSVKCVLLSAFSCYIYIYFFFFILLYVYVAVQSILEWDKSGDVITKEKEENKFEVESVQ